MDVTELVVFLLLALPTLVLADLRPYHFVNQLMNWTDAQSYCKENFNDLASIQTPDDWVRVSEMLAHLGHTQAHIGLYDDVKEWRWSLDNAYLSEQDLGGWLVFYEDNYLSSEHCGTLHGTGMYDKPCDLVRPSVCYDETSNSYIRVTTGMTWHDAQSYCRQTYTDLASIKNQQELNDVLSAMDPSLGHWIGLFREGWKWLGQGDNTFMELTGAFRGGVFLCGKILSTARWKDGKCTALQPFVCSAPPRKVLRVTLKTDGSVDLSDPLVQEGILKQMEKDLRAKGVSQEFILRWRKSAHGDVFNKTEL